MGSVVELPLFMALVEVGQQGEHTVSILKPIKQWYSMTYDDTHMRALNI